MRRGIRSRWLAAFLLLGATAAMAENPSVPFSDQVFAVAQAQERRVVVETYAPWCLPCRIQSPILERLHSQAEFRDLVILRIEEGTPKAVWRRFKLHGYGNLIVFKGSSETARGTPTSEPAAAALLRTAR